MSSIWRATGHTWALFLQLLVQQGKQISTINIKVRDTKGVLVKVTFKMNKN